MSKPEFIQLHTGEKIPILYEDRSVLAIDKPRGWLLVPAAWQNTSRNLQSEISASIRAREFWAVSRHLKFLRFVHRLDAETTGVLLFAKSPGAVAAFSDLFESRRVEMTYLAIVQGEPVEADWICRRKLAPDPGQKGRMRVDNTHGKDAETRFSVVQRKPGLALVEARPLTGRTHQLRVHLASEGLPVLGDELYGRSANALPLALRAISLRYRDPFTRRPVDILAPAGSFVQTYGFDPEKLSKPEPLSKVGT